MTPFLFTWISWILLPDKTYVTVGGGGGDRCHGGGGPNAAQHCLFGTTDRWSSEFSSAHQLVDDLGYNAPGYNNADLHTPTIDGLAAGMPRELIEA